MNIFFTPFAPPPKSFNSSNAHVLVFRYVHFITDQYGQIYTVVEEPCKKLGGGADPLFF